MFPRQDVLEDWELSNVKKTWRIWVGILISLVFIWYALRGQDFAAIKDSLGQVNYLYLVPAIGLYFIGVYIRSFRWSILLRPVAKTNANELFSTVAVGFMANNVLPLRTGEVVRAFVLAKRFNVSKTAALATIAIERLFDGLTMLGFMLVAATAVSFTSQLRHLTIVAFVVFTVILLGLVVLTLGGSFRDRLIQLVLGPLPTPVADRVERMAESFLSGLGVLRNKRDLSLVGLASIAAWLFEASMYWAIARGFGSDLAPVMTVPATLLTTGVANLATLIPSSPGYVGPFEAGVMLVLNGALDVPKALALSFAVVVHAALYLPITLWGAVEWFRQHLSWSQVQAEREADDDSVVLEPVAPEKVR